MTASTGGRERIEAALRHELLGPAPAGKPLSISGPVHFPSHEAARGPWIDEATREEILDREPLVRYGVGVLYPQAQTAGAELADQQIIAGLTAEEPETPDAERWEGTKKSVSDKSDDQDFDLAGANEIKPTAMGISFLLEQNQDTELEIVLTAGRYRQIRVDIAGSRERTWWARSPLRAVWRIPARKLAQAPGTQRHLEPLKDGSSGLDGLSPRLTLNLLPRARGMLVTAALTNNSAVGTHAIATKCLFQTSLKVTPRQGFLTPYPEPEDSSSHPDDESFRLIYREAQTYAVGHGCAADWGPVDDGKCAWAAADPLPAYEVPSITPDIKLRDGSRLTVSMAQLAGLEPGGTTQLERVIDAYAEWIGERRTQAEGLDTPYQETAETHIERCAAALERMREGLRLITEDPEGDVARAFRLANEAMLKQQLRSSAQRRETTIQDGRIHVAGSPPDEAEAARSGRGNWRAFQIAFLLAALPSAADPSHPEREAVDLIFFPTGGGKTEAYLGLSAFVMLLRRLRNHDDVSVTVLMRYTLRLLTTQQFLRAAALICALENIRENRTDLGQEQFSIGIWVGSDSTPNSRDQAVKDLRELNRGTGHGNPFLLLRCPWCSAQMGPVRSTDDSSRPRGRGGRKGRGERGSVAGYEEREQRVVFLCPDRQCHFSDPKHPLPIYVVDDDVYEFRPSLIIGTVDKFALLAWREEARAIFGIGESGSRVYSPPELVIQDELHLIAGPLGSMTGLYESVIVELCTDYRRAAPAAPKIIASTATIRRHEEQIRALYGRGRVNLFPPHGIDAKDSFFAVYDRDSMTDELLPGRKYVGVHGPALGSMQTVQVRSFSALLQAAKDAPGEERDPWWTLMIFFNSLRELGNSLSLMQSDIPDYLKTINNRSNTDRTALRYLNRVEEMTSRLRQDQIPEAMEKLSAKAVGDKPKAIDACLASSLIEVGIDIDRLSLMTIVGQPKSTSQYIQVTGRVGRQAKTRPGLVVTLYGAAKPRDRSHFERFRSYHQRLYAQVEPTSATPFSPPALDRALHAVLISYIRQTIPRYELPSPIPQDAFDRAADLLRERARISDPDELPRLNQVIAKRQKHWTDVQPDAWGAPGGEITANQLLRPAGQYVQEGIAALSWPTPTSMRGADAECRARVTTRYPTGEEDAQ
ncbi:helicase-related protein [Streptomyces sp. NPDC102381]|uniref:helicase-related protein n=1 Tax=Streptomyces sp. NPDC102381 TaxID=3366164 RepID=UPI0038131A8E